MTDLSQYNLIGEWKTDSGHKIKIKHVITQSPHIKYEGCDDSGNLIVVDENGLVFKSMGSLEQRRRSQEENW